MFFESVVELFRTYANEGTFALIFFTFFVSSYLVRRLLTHYEVASYQSSLESVGESIFVSAIIAFFWPISAVFFIAYSINAIIEFFAKSIAGRISAK